MVGESFLSEQRSDEPTLDVWVLRLDSVANPLPQMLQWKGLFLARSTCASWLRRCCCRLDSWMNARPQSGRWHLYGRSPRITRSSSLMQPTRTQKFGIGTHRHRLEEFPTQFLWEYSNNKCIVNILAKPKSIMKEWDWMETRKLKNHI